MWFEQIGVWFQSALDSGMLTLGTITSGSVFVGIKSWLSGLSANRNITTLQTAVIGQDELIKKMADDIAILKNQNAVLLQALEGNFIAVNKLAQNSSININAKEELTKLSASVLPLFKTQEQLQTEISNIGASITKPLTELEKQALAKKEELQKLATDKVNETQVKIDSTLNATFDKFKQGVGNLLDTAKDTILGDKQA